jgi:hypothetical protein
MIEEKISLHCRRGLDGTRSYIGLVLTVFFMPIAVQATHPFHTSLTEMDWNPQADRWEVGIRVDANDLEQAVLKHSGKSISLEKHSADGPIESYVAAKFRLMPRGLLPVRSSDDTRQQTMLLGGLSDAQATNGSPTESLQKEFIDRRDRVNPMPAQADSNRVTASGEKAESAPMYWLGHELEGSWVWLYFELEVTGPGMPTVVVNSILGEINEDQINILSIRHGNSRYSLQTSSRRWWAELSPVSAQDSVGDR